MKTCLATRTRGNMPKQRKKASEDTTGTDKRKTVVAKRHRGPKGGGREGISRPGYRRLARRAGVKRMGDSTYGQADQQVESHVTDLLWHCIHMIQYAKKKTIGRTEVAEAYKLVTGRTFAGLPENNGAKAKFMKRGKKKTEDATEE